MSAFAGQRVLVTGAGGFIGSHLVEALVADGAHVRAFVHYNSRNDWGNLDALAPEILGEVEVRAGEIADPFGVARVLTGCETVFHLAALIGIPYSYIAPASYLETNIRGTLNVLEAARHADARVVHTSTSETYGTAQYTPIDERHPLVGQSPYSATKIGADQLAESYARSMDVRVSTLRPFNTYGPRQSLRAVIPTITAQALSGTTVRLGSLEPIRDFTFVEDTVRAFLAVAATPDTIGLTLNAGTGEGITIGALARLLLELTGSDAEIELDPERVRPERSEVLALLADARRLSELTGWKPAVPLRDGLARVIDWMRTRPPEGRAHQYTV